MKSLMQKWLRIEKGEGKKAWQLFSYIFLLISSLLIIKPVANSLFIQNLGIQSLPMGFVLVALVSGLLMSVYIPFSAKLNLIALLSSTFLICLGTMAVFWALLSESQSSSLVFFSFYIWISIYGVITASQFWLLSGKVLNARQGKRLFGFIGSGGIAGGIFGGYLTTGLVESMGTRNLIGISIVFLGICAYLSRAIWMQHLNESGGELPAQSRIGDRSGTSKNPFKLIVGSRLVLYISLIVTLSVAAATLSDYVFRYIASHNFENEDELTRFFGLWQSNLSVIALVVQLFFTSKIISKFGIGTALSLLPVGITIGALSIIFSPILFSAVLLKLSDGIFKQSIYKSGMEMLYFPIPSAIKKKIKGFIDVFLDNTATGLTGILLLCIVNGYGWSVEKISFLILIITSAWLAAVFLIKKSYLQSFRSAIEKRTIDFDDPAGEQDSSYYLKYLEEAVSSGNPRRILYMLDLFGGLKSKSHHLEFTKIVGVLLEHKDIEVRFRAIMLTRNQLKNQYIEKLIEIVDSGPQKLRIESMHTLFQWSSHSILYLKKHIKSGHYAHQWAALICAARECQKNDSLKDFLIQDPDVRKFFNLNTLDSLSKEESIFAKRALGQVIGTAKLPVLYPFLEKLLEDNNRKVVLSCIPQAGNTKSTYFCVRLIYMLGNPKLNRAAREALTAIGGDTNSIIEKFLADSNTDEKIRKELPRTLSYMVSQKSVTILESYLKGSAFDFYVATVRALSGLKSRDPSLRFNKNLLTSECLKVLNKWHQTNSIYQKILKEVPTEPAKQAHLLLIRALREKKESLLELCFRIMGLCYIQADFWNAYQGVRSGNSRLRANAIEFMDNQLDRSLKKRLFPILESKPVKHRERLQPKLSAGLKAGSPQLLILLTQENDPWIATCSLFLLIQSKSKLDSDKYLELKNSRHSLLSETASLVDRPL